MKKLIAILMLTLVTVFAFAGGWKNIYSGTSFTELQVDGSCRIVMWDATDKDGGYMTLQNMADFIFNQDLVTNFQADSVTAANVRAATYNFADSTTVGGTGDAITIDFTPDLTCTFGTIIYFIAEHTNTTAVTLNVDGGGNDAVIEAHDLSALDANDIRDKMPIQLMYNDTSWVQISQSGN